MNGETMRVNTEAMESILVDCTDIKVHMQTGWNELTHSYQRILNLWQCQNHSEMEQYVQSLQTEFEEQHAELESILQALKDVIMSYQQTETTQINESSTLKSNILD